METWVRFLHSPAHTPSLTQYFIQTIWLLLQEPFDTGNQLLVACMKWSLHKRLQTVRTTVQTEGFFPILPVIMCIWVSSSFLAFMSKITFCSASEKKLIKHLKSYTYINEQCKPWGAERRGGGGEYGKKWKFWSIFLEWEIEAKNLTQGQNTDKQEIYFWYLFKLNLTNRMGKW